MKEREEPPKINLELIDFKISSLVNKVDQMQLKLDNGFVERIEFELRTGRLEKIVYGMVGTILLVVVGAIISLVIKK